MHFLRFVIDFIFTERGHETLSSLPYHCHITAQQFIWSVVKAKAVYKIAGRSRSDAENVMTRYRTYKSEGLEM
jgi:hypothetical protein